MTRKRTTIHWQVPVVYPTSMRDMARFGRDARKIACGCLTVAGKYPVTYTADPDGPNCKNCKRVVRARRRKGLPT